jgi:hypothetical protein
LAGKLKKAGFEIADSAEEQPSVLTDRISAESHQSQIATSLHGTTLNPRN